MSSTRVWVLCTGCGATYPRDYQRCPRDGQILVTTTIDPMIGSVLDHHYRVDAMIGEGLLGRVYRARNLRLSRDVAIKVAEETALTHGQARLRLLSEAEAGCRLDHPNVVAVLDIGELPSGQPYLVLEHAEGETLRAHLARHGRISVAASLALAHQLALGLEHVHGLGLVHRDLTPDNVIVGPDARARILDFGLALSLASGRKPKRVTDAGFVIGTPPYMAPEQRAGEPIDSRADLYSLGVLLLQMVSGAVPLDGTPTRRLIARSLFEPDARPPVDHAVDALIARLVAYQPADRIGSASAVVTELAIAIERQARGARRILGAPGDWDEVPTAQLRRPVSATAR